MIVSLANTGGDVALEESGFAPASLGEILSGALHRRKFSIEHVAGKSGLTPDVIQALIEGRMALDRVTARKLQAVFPKTMRLFLNVQRSHQFYVKYGVMRPTSHLRRAMIKRRARAAAAQPLTPTISRAQSRLADAADHAVQTVGALARQGRGKPQAV